MVPVVYQSFDDKYDCLCYMITFCVGEKSEKVRVICIHVYPPLSGWQHDEGEHGVLRE